jgi:hypothetical protein
MKMKTEGLVSKYCIMQTVLMIPEVSEGIPRFQAVANS